MPKANNVLSLVELGVVIGKLGRDIKASQAEQYIAGYVLALDMTNRTLQQEAQKKGHPWAAAKGADTFTPIRFVTYFLIYSLLLLLLIPFILV